MWHVTVNDDGHRHEWLSIGPHKDDPADAFAFSQNYPMGWLPDDVIAKFRLMAAAPVLEAAVRHAIDKMTALHCGKFKQSYIESELAKLADELCDSLAKAVAEPPSPPNGG